MATRTTRMRPLDNNKPLDIIRIVDDLDAKSNDEGGLGGRELEQTIEALDKKKDEDKARKQQSTDIPIPTVAIVGSYMRDYMPSFQEPSTYIRGRGALGYLDEKFIEYDLDAADKAWLEANINKGQNRLPPRRFEMLLWRLELANAAATERTLSAAGASSTERNSAAAVAAVDHMPKLEAIQAVQAAHPVRDVTAHAVYSYWRSKRMATKKPLLRRLQAPTSASDSNPMLVFRPREKIHRPQTRRRRENNEDSVDKLKAIRANLAATRDMCEAITRREQRKLNLLFNEIDEQQLHLKLRHEPSSTTDAVMAEYMAAAKAKPPHRPIGFEGGPSAALRVPATATSFNAAAELRRLQKKRKRDTRRPDAMAIQQLGPPPLPQDPDMLFAALPDASRLPQGEILLPAGVDKRRVRARIGRGGRLMFDRADALTLEPLYEPATETPNGNNNNSNGGDGNEKIPKRPTDVVKPLWKLPNPYAPAKGGNQGGNQGGANQGGKTANERGGSAEQSAAAGAVEATQSHAAVKPIGTVSAAKAADALGRAAALQGATAARQTPQQAQMRLRDAHVSSLPVNVRAARDAIGSLLTKSGSQIRPNALPALTSQQQHAASGKPQCAVS
ncbi:hypothetical protein WJX73_007747 [Symbiochloris irregularis]|uniref:Enhancer of polycomb-like protein n=1 Tax=Symbiochloris irregularis TaxID=706552 RepID=A0AAW1NQE5_9CHLO